MAIIPPLGGVLNAPSTKKLLVLDVNGLLADIVPVRHVPYNLKADIIVSGKAGRVGQLFILPFSFSFLLEIILTGLYLLCQFLEGLFLTSFCNSALRDSM